MATLVSWYASRPRRTPNGSGLQPMPVKVIEKGMYELFETNHHHQILVLNRRQWFALVRGQKGDILVRTNSDHIRDHTIQRGRFYLVDFIQDPKFKDMPHL